MTAADFLPQRRTIPALAGAAADCRGCELYRRATQTVFGEGSSRAKLVIVGEQPGDREDIEGRPFVGPAGRLLDEAIEAAGLKRTSVYITNAVKHFKWEPRGKKRLHKKPSAREIKACRPWLDAEIEVIHPTGIVCLGATSAQAILGSEFRVSQHRGEVQESELADWCLATWHPSAVLRAPTSEAREQMREELFEDFLQCAKLLGRD